MKKILLFILDLYQKYLSPFLHRLFGIKPGQGCRYSPTCSQYAKIHITKEGVMRGGAKTLARLVYCHPFAPKLPKALQK